MNDGAECIINSVLCAMREVFSPSSSYPPVGGGSETVAFFACEATPLSAVDLQGCNTPFLWVRLMRRYRSETFPAPYVGGANCALQEVIALEVGVARCALTLDENGNPPSLADYAREAEISLDDSWRIQRAMCRAVTLMRKNECSDMGAQDVTMPYGPDGGIVAWIGTLYARVDS